MEYFAGIVVSLIVQVVKKYGGTSTPLTMVVLAAFSIAGAAVMMWLQASSFWPMFASILVSAAGFHNIVLRQLSSKA